MAKLNLDKMNGPGALRTDGQREIRSTGIQPTVSVDPPSPAAETDKIEISDRAAEVGRLVGRIKTLPDVREDKVTNLRGRVASGDYHPAPQTIADAIINEEAN